VLTLVNLKGAFAANNNPWLREKWAVSLAMEVFNF
jgi:hypothetical protein